MRQSWDSQMIDGVFPSKRADTDLRKLKRLSSKRRPCPYCCTEAGEAVRTGLPGNACENCMNTGWLDQCPHCGGDCSGANPPVTDCPMSPAG